MNLRKGLVVAAAILGWTAGTRAQTAVHVTLAGGTLSAELGRPVTLRARVDPAPSAGAVSFIDAGVLLGTANVVDGAATINGVTLPAGAHALRAVFSGGGNYGPAESAVWRHNVRAGNAGGFLTPRYFAVGRDPRAIAQHDWNGDGIADLAVANAASDSVSILLGKADGGFTPAAQYLSGGAPHALTAADFNGDGKPDLAIANSRDNTVSVFLGRGDGSFAPAAPVRVGAFPEALAAGDFNADGRADLAVANRESNTVTILLGQGDGSFLAMASIAVGSAPSALGVADFNDDGFADLAVANSGSDSIGILLGRGDGNFRLAASVGTGRSPRSLAIADFDGDGIADLAAVNRGSENVTILLGGGDGSFHAAPSFASRAPSYAVTGDFDGDGNLDLAVAAGNSVDIHLGRGDGTFLAGEPRVPGNAAALAVGDFNRDGRTDLAIANAAGAGLGIVLATSPATTSVSLVSSANPSMLGNAITLTATVTPGTAGGKVEFLDGVTLLGVGTVASGQAQFFTSLLGPGPHMLVARYTGVPGSFAASYGSVAQTVNALPSNSFLPLTAHISAPAYSAAFGDFDNNGKPDLAVANGSPLVLLGNGDGTFTQRGFTGSTPFAFAVADFDGDGKADLASLDLDTQTVDIMLGSGDGRAQTVATPATGTTAGGVVTADFNNDGLADFAVSNGDANTVIVKLGQGTGHFGAPITVPTNSSPGNLVVADFNGDGKTDIAVAGATKVGILLGNGNGTFTAAPSPTVDAQWLAVSDLNGDGNADLAAMTDEGSLVILLGNGDGTFTMGTSLTVSSGIAGLAVGDFNADGKPDLVAVASSQKVAWLWLGNGDGSFTAAPSLAVGSFPVWAGMADLNGDGRMDLVVDNNGSNTFTILLGQPSALSVTQTHMGNFPQGQQGVTSTITVSNAAGAVTTSGTVTVTESISALTFVSLSGSGWSCTGRTCTRSDPLAPGISYPSITLTQNIPSTAYYSNANQVTVSGGSSGPATAADFVLVSAAILTLSKTHTGNFARGQQGVTYTLTVSNMAGAYGTSGTVMVTELQPTGLSVSGMSGTGWFCYGITCSRTDSLAAGLSFPDITVTADVNLDAPLQLSNQANVTAGNADTVTASDPTTIIGSLCDVTNDGSTNLADVQRMVNEALGSAAAGDVNQDGTTNVVDIEIVIRAVLGGTCQAS